MQLHRLASSLAALVLATSPALAGDFWVVDVTGGGDFTQLQAAIDHAADGDTVLIRGYYNVFESVGIQNKGISLVQEPPTTTSALNRIWVYDLAAQKQFYAAGIDAALILYDNAGHIVLESCRLHPSYDDPSVRNCADVVYYDCSLHGRYGGDDCNPYDYLDGGPSLKVSQGSKVALYHCTLEGGDGGTDHCGMGMDGCGGSGIVVRDESAVFEAGCTFSQGSPECWFFPDVDVEAGSTLTSSLAPASLFIGPTLAQEGSTVTLRVAGPPGEHVWLLTSTQGTRRFISPEVGILHQDSGPPLFLGTIPASGLLSANYTLPLLPPGSAAERFWCQALLSTPAAPSAPPAVGAERLYLSNAKGWVIQR